MYVNVNNGERSDFVETAKTTTSRRFLGAISFLYRHDNVYPCADPGIFGVRGWVGGIGPTDRKNSDFFYSGFL